VKCYFIYIIIIIDLFSNEIFKISKKLVNFINQEKAAIQIKEQNVIKFINCYFTLYQSN